jgi:hypothetical protein
MFGLMNCTVCASPSPATTDDADLDDQVFGLT